MEREMNKKYDLLGVGIAAVDDLIYVADYPPADCKIPVSGSTRQGGGPACTAIAAAATLGGHVAYSARFGGNELSAYIATALDARGADTSLIIDDPAGGPYHSIIVVDSAGHRTVFYDPSLYTVVAPDDWSDALIQSAAIVLLDHITEPSLLPLTEKVHRLGVPILGDIEGISESSIRLAALADYLIVPKAFAAWASGCSNPRDACAFLARNRRLATIVTDGADGCYFSTGVDPAIRHFPAFQVEVFDTTGCGDTFHGAFALAAARHFAIEDAITFATAAAALKATAGGGQRRGWKALPTLEEVSQFLRAALKDPEKSLLLEKIRALKTSQPAPV
jgi:sugar/nucleoside kinase (ribokinase family)